MKKILFLAFLGATVSSFAQTTLGAFTFNDNQFGDSVVESDGGALSSTNWLNTVDANPGNPGFLTGANFETGVANVGYPSPTYTIGYGTPIVNLAGDDFAVVVARFSTDDVRFSLSKTGSGFGSEMVLSAGAFVDSLEDRSYYAGPNNGPYASSLFVASLDLSDYGFANGEMMDAITIGTGPNSNQLDLIRVAGLNPVPEPMTMGLLGLGTLVALGRKKRAA